MSSNHNMKKFVGERAGAAAAGRTHGRYEENSLRYDEELDRQRRLLYISMNQQIQLHNIAFPLCFLSEHGDSFHQRKNSSMKQEHHEAPIFKGQQQELYLNHVKKQDHFMLNPAFKVNEQSGGDLSHLFLTQNVNVAAGRDQGRRKCEALPAMNEDMMDSNQADERGGSQVKAGSGHSSLQHPSWSDFQRNLCAQRFVSAENQASEQERCVKEPGEKGTTTQKWKVIMDDDSGAKHIEECGITFLAKGRRVRRVKKKLGCSECGKSFGSGWNLKLHMRTHTGEKPFYCVECGQSFSRRSQLKQHTRIHTGEKPHTCTVCGKGFSRNGNLTLHMRTHTGEKPFSCTECGQTFSRRPLLKQHMPTHTGELPYRCAECGTRFRARSSLRSHTKIEKGETPFCCTECGQTFMWRCGFVSHMRIHAGSSYRE